MRPSCLLSIALNAFTAWAVSIQDINGDAFLSPLNGQNVTNVAGIVTAKSSTGIYLRSPTIDRSKTTSDSIFVFSSTVGSNLTVGDSILLDGKVSEYRSSSEPTYLFLTELTTPRNVRKVSSGVAVAPVLVGTGGRVPPTKQFSSLDNGDVYGYPNAVSQISVVNPVLLHTRYGIDFWESLSAELVMITNVTAINRPNSYRETWVRGDWPVTGLNARGGLTVTDKGKSLSTYCRRDTQLTNST
jgi:hypothetical protein